jgi:hypothetical protein
MRATGRSPGYQAIENKKYFCALVSANTGPAASAERHPKNPEMTGNLSQGRGLYESASTSQQ